MSDLDVIKQAFMATGLSASEAGEKACEILHAAAMRGYAAALQELSKSAPPGRPLKLPACGPFILSYEESGVEDEVFSGEGALDAAIRRFLSVSSGYHCRLYAPVRSSIQRDIQAGRIVEAGQVA